MYHTASLGMEDKPRSTFLIPDGLTCGFFYAKAIFLNVRMREIKKSTICALGIFQLFDKYKSKAVITNFSIFGNFFLCWMSCEIIILMYKV